jgi:photosystem II stability/assembly factor-like uncharacterized protein
MSDESVFGGLGEAWDAGVSAVENVAGAAEQTAEGVGQMAWGSGDHLVATGAELLGQQDLRDEWDNAAVDHREAAFSDFSQAGEDLSAAGHDVVGDVEIDPSMLYNEAE